MYTLVVDGGKHLDSGEWSTMPKRDKVAIWTCAVLLGAACGLLFDFKGNGSSLSTIGLVGCFLFPILGSTLVVYGKFSFRQRPVDERHQAVFLLSAFGFLFAIAIAAALKTYVPGLEGYERNGDVSSTVNISTTP